MTRASIAVLVCALLACASTPLPQASFPIDWAAVAAEDVPEIVTVDADGDVRRTKLWLVVVDGAGYVRTSETRWNANMLRDPNVTLDIGGAAHALRAVPVLDTAIRGRVHESFGLKYGGFADTLAGWFGDREASSIWRLEAR